VREALHDSARLPSLGELADVAGVHEVHLARAFRASYGCTIGGYFRTVRLGRALAMLRGSNDAIAEIALACGYADQSHLTRDVRNATGLTPAELRTR
jgi:AraC family transcriptional regulator